ncbi:histidine--tRNA ligase [Patescibacteria group bacterium]|nr:histidine--tRNA ligase [Patescibacteria group bacterium]
MKYQTPTGMRDLLDEDLKYFQKIEKTGQEILEFYGFRKIETPILEQSALFEKGTGESTDIVQKQMFCFQTKGGDALTLRPEATPSVVRAFLERGMESFSKPVKLWSFGPFFRYERPQAGRFRQFYQLNIDSIGSESWIIDAQIIQISYNILKNLGLSNLIIKINSIGDSQCRPYYKKALIEHLRRSQSSLCPDCKKRFKTNPLRIMDCKEEKCQTKIREGAPQILDHLCKECHLHFKNVLESLDELGLPYILDPYLVRGLDYYTKTVFEIFTEPKEQETSLALAAGGRYDNLVKTLGGKETPACGIALGVDRIASLLKKENKKYFCPSKIFLIQIGELAKRKSLKLLEDFRKEKIKLTEALCKDSLTLQLKIADKLKAKYVLILGQQEALEEKIIIRDMKTGNQKTVTISKAIKEMKKCAKK